MVDQDFQITPKLLDSLYIEAMVLADEARSYFDSSRMKEDTVDDPLLAVALSCESLKVTTRLMHCIAWLLNQRAIFSGELSSGEIWNRDRPLGYEPVSDHEMVDRFPKEAQQIIRASEYLLLRLDRLANRLHGSTEDRPQVRAMHRLLQASF